MEKKNSIRFILMSAFLGLAHIFAMGQVMQGYLNHIGFSAGKISAYVSFSNIAQVISMVLLFFFADKIKNMKRAAQICFYVMALFFVLLIGMQFLSIGKNVMFIFLLISACIYCASYAIEAILSYRIPYTIIDMKNYGKLSSLTSIVGQVLGISVSLIFSVLVATCNYDAVILSCFIAGILFLLLGAFTANRFEMKNVFETREKPKHKDVFREKSLLHLAPMHYVRGIINGCFAMATVIFISNVSGNEKLTAPLVVIHAVGTVLSSVLYLVLIKKIRSTIYTIIGGATVGAALIIMSVTSNALVFYTVYFLGAIGMYFVDNSIPIFVAEFVSGRIIGGYTTIRMLITNFGMATGNMLVGIFSENDVLSGGLTTVGIVAAVVGILFYIYDKKVVEKRGNSND